MNELKNKIKDLVEAINLAYAKKDVRKVMFVDFSWYCCIYTESMEDHTTRTLFQSMNYKECRIRLDWYLEAL